VQVVERGVDDYADAEVRGRGLLCLIIDINIILNRKKKNTTQRNIKNICAYIYRFATPVQYRESILTVTPEETVAPRAQVDPCV
jgi:hypothetical protein